MEHGVVVRDPEGRAQFCQHASRRREDVGAFDGRRRPTKAVRLLLEQFALLDDADVRQRHFATLGGVGSEHSGRIANEECMRTTAPMATDLPKSGASAAGRQQCSGCERQRYSPPMTTPPARRVDPALLVILAGVVAALHVGKLPPAIPVLRDALGLTLVQAGFLLSLVQLAGMAVGVVFGVIADSLGSRRSMMLGLVLLAIVSALGGLAQGVAPLMLLRAAEGFGFLLVVLPAPGLVRGLVEPQRVSAMMGLWGAYMPLATALALLVGPLAIAAIGWRGW